MRTDEDWSPHLGDRVSVGACSRCSSACRNTSTGNVALRSSKPSERMNSATDTTDGRPPLPAPPPPPPTAARVVRRDGEDSTVVGSCQRHDVGRAVSADGKESNVQIEV